MLVYQRVLFMIYHDLPIGPYLLAFMEASINQPARITSVEKKSCYHGAGWWLVEPAWNVFRKKSRGTTNLVHSGSSLNLSSQPENNGYIWIPFRLCSRNRHVQTSFSCEAGHIWAQSFWAFRHLNCSKFSGPTTRAVVSALAACRGRSSRFPTLSRCSYFVLAETAMKLEIPSLLSTILSKLLRFWWFVGLSSVIFLYICVYKIDITRI